MLRSNQLKDDDEEIFQKTTNIKAHKRPGDLG